MNRRASWLKSEKANRKAHLEAGLFTHFSVKPSFRTWQGTMKARKAWEACVHDFEGLNRRQLLGLLEMEVISGAENCFYLIGLSAQQRVY